MELDPHELRFLNFSSAEIKNLDLLFCLATLFDHEVENFSRKVFKKQTQRNSKMGLWEDLALMALLT